MPKNAQKRNKIERILMFKNRQNDVCKIVDKKGIS